MSDDLWFPEEAAAVRERIAQDAPAAAQPQERGWFDNPLNMLQGALRGGVRAGEAGMGAYRSFRESREQFGQAMGMGSANAGDQQVARDLGLLNRDEPITYDGLERLSRFRRENPLLRPNPQETGAASQLFGDMAEVLTPYFTPGLGAGAGAIAMGDFGVERSRDAGVTNEDALANVWRSEAAWGLAQAFVPNAFVSRADSLFVRMGQRALTGAGLNAIVGVGERGTTGAILRHYGYDEHAAEQYNMLDGQQILADVLIGGVFGATLPDAPTRGQPPSVERFRQQRNQAIARTFGFRPRDEALVSPAVEDLPDLEDTPRAPGPGGPLTHTESPVPEPDQAEALRARLAQVEQEARTDAMTGLRNRRAFDEDEGQGWSHVGALDMDGLKALNDAFGHDSGDAVIRQIGNVLRAAEGEDVRFYRTGGDEFVARFRNEDDAAATMRDVQNRLERVEVVIRSLPDAQGNRDVRIYPGIRVSVGHGATLEAADAALYANKTERRSGAERRGPDREDGSAPRRSDVSASPVEDRGGGDAQPDGRSLLEEAQSLEQQGDSYGALVNAILAKREGEPDAADMIVRLSRGWSFEELQRALDLADELATQDLRDAGASGNPETLHAALVLKSDAHAQLNMAPGIPVTHEARARAQRSFDSFAAQVADDVDEPDVRTEWGEPEPGEFAPRPDDISAMAADIEYANRALAGRPQTLTQWVRAEGGIRQASDRGDVGDTQDRARGFAALLRPDGREIDGDLATAAWEQGFFPDFAEPPTENEFSEALRDDFSGVRRVVADVASEEEAQGARNVLDFYRKQGVDTSLRGQALRANLRAFVGEDSPRDPVWTGLAEQAESLGFDASVVDEWRAQGREPDVVREVLSLEARVRASGDVEGLLSSSEAPTFFSAVERTIEGSRTARASGSQWWSTISRAPGVKREELEWIGLEDFLRGQEGAISREDVLSFVRANGVRVEETVLGGGGDRATAIQGQLLPLIEEQDRLWRERRDENGGLMTTSPRQQEIDARLSEIEPEISRLQEEGRAVRTANTARWSQMVLPGGQHYRELLLRLPVGPEVAARDARMSAIDVELQGIPPGAQFDTKRNELRTEYRDLADVRQKNAPFRSSHWDAPNVLAHVRFNERVDAAGNRTLFLEEVQSDWHQGGRERGYKDQNEDSATKAALAQQVDEALAETNALYDDAARARGYDNFFSDMALDESAQDARAALMREVESSEQYREVKGRFDELNARYRQPDMWRAPNAPFKNNAWAALVLKRMIRYASENGFEQVAWIPGRIQNGREVGETGDNRGAFYDRILPNIANDLGKRYGARVGEARISVPSDRAQTSAYRPEDFAVDHRGNEWAVTMDRSRVPGRPLYATRAEAEAALRDILGNYSDRTETVHSLPITPDMRDDAMQGQALFSNADTRAPFNPDMVLYRGGPDPQGGPVFLTPNIGIAEQYGDVRAYNVRGNLLDARERLVFDQSDLNTVLREAREGGYAGVRIRASDRGRIGDQEQVVMLGRANIRPAPESRRTALLSSIAREFGEETQNLIDAGNLVIVENPEALRQILRMAGLDNLATSVTDGARGFNLRGVDKSYLVASNIRPDIARGVLLHEVGVHHGMEQMLGRRGFSALKLQFNLLAQNGHPLAKLALERAQADTALRSKRGEANPNRFEAEEAIAYLVETAPDLPLVRRIIAQVRQWLWRTFGVTFGRSLSVDDIRALAVASLRRMATQARREVQAREQGGVVHFTQPEAQQATLLTSAREQGYQGRDIGEAEEWVRTREKFRAAAASGSPLRVLSDEARAYIAEHGGTPEAHGEARMLEPERMAWAREGGFVRRLYHGTTRSVRQFASEEIGSGVGAREGERAFWLTASPSDGSEFAASGIGDGQNVMPVLARGRLDDFDANGKSYEDIDTTGILDRARGAGFDGVAFHNMMDEAIHDASNAPFAEQVAIFDPRNIRSRFAAFDPDYSESANLLASADFGGSPISDWRALMGTHPWINSPSRAQLVQMARDGASGEEIAMATGYRPTSSKALLSQARRAGVDVARRPNLGGRSADEINETARRNARIYDLRYRDDMSNKDIAYRLGISENLVAQALRAERGRRSAEGLLSSADDYDFASPEGRELWTMNETLSAHIPGERASARQYGFELDDGKAVVTSIAPDDNGWATIDWTFQDRLERDLPPYTVGQERPTRAMADELMPRLFSILEQDMSDHDRDGYVFTPYTAALRRRYLRGLEEFGFRNYSVLEEGDDIYLIRDGADLGQDGRILPRQGRARDTEDGPVSQDPEADARAFYARARAFHASRRDERLAAESARASAAEPADSGAAPSSEVDGTSGRDAGGIEGLLSSADDESYHNLDPARQVIAEEPDLTLPTERGEEPAMAALDNAEAARQDAEGMRQGFEAAVRCAIRHAGALSGRAGHTLDEAARSIIIGQGAGALAAVPASYGISAFASQDAMNRFQPREMFRQRTAAYNARHPMRVGADGYLDSPVVNLPETPQETMGRDWVEGTPQSNYGARPVEYPGIRDTGLDTTNTASYDRNALTGAPLFQPADAPEGSIPEDADPRVHAPTARGGQTRLPRYRDNQ